MSLFKFLVPLLLSALAFSATPAEEYAARLKAFETQATHHEFKARDGARISYTVVGPSSGRSPLVVSIGKGETDLRYMDLAERLMARGHGPILILEHRGQGRSERPLPDKPHTVFVQDFNEYVDDLIDFMDGPVKVELRSMGVRRKPMLLAHSMGGAIADLALLKRPDLADRVAYIAPMFSIKAPNALLGIAHDKPMKTLAELLCFAGCGQSELPSSPYMPDAEKVQARMRLEQSRALERKLRIDVQGATLQWIKEAIGATDTVRERAAEHSTRSLILSGSEDTVVDNSAMVEYACSARNCSVVELKGGHALHQEEDAVIDILADELDHFYRTGQAVSPRAQACPGLFRVVR